MVCVKSSNRSVYRARVFSRPLLGGADVKTLSTLNGSVNNDELHSDQSKPFHYTI